MRKQKYKVIVYFQTGINLPVSEISLIAFEREKGQNNKSKKKKNWTVGLISRTEKPINY
mgnify:CR=1 FL=1